MQKTKLLKLYSDEFFEELEQTDFAYKKFKRAVNNTKTLYTYRNLLREFLRFSRKQSYTEIVKLKPSYLQELLEEYVDSLKEREIKNKTILNKLCAPELFLDMNMILYHKRILHKQIPKDNQVAGGDKPYTTEDIKRMLESTTKFRSRTLIHFLASTGARPAAIDDPVLRIKHLEDMPYGCKAIKIYDESKEGYWAFLTPEASKAMDVYLKSRKNLTPESPLFANFEEGRTKKVDYMTVYNATRVIKTAIKDSGIERVKKGNRFDKAQNTAFRKRFNTILKINNDVNSNIAEKLMAHKRGLDGSYLKPTREECFTEFIKAVPQLTIDQSEKQKQLIKNLETENSELEKKADEIKNLIKRVEELEYGPKARGNEFTGNMFKHYSNNTQKLLDTIFYIWFEMRATEKEKRRIWKKLQQAKEKGEKIDMSLFGETKNLSWKNLRV